MKSALRIVPMNRLLLRNYRDVVEHLVYGGLCLKRVVHAELHRSDVKRPRERLGWEGRSGLHWVVVGITTRGGGRH